MFLPLMSIDICTVSGPSSSSISPHPWSLLPVHVCNNQTSLLLHVSSPFCTSPHLFPALSADISTVAVNGKLSHPEKKRKKEVDREKKNNTLCSSCVSLWLPTIESTMWDCSGLAACQQLWGVSTEARPLATLDWILPIPTQLWNVS